MTFYRSQIDNLETHLSGVQASSSISSVELAQILQKLHESFISLAAQLHAVHEVVQVRRLIQMFALPLIQSFFITDTERVIFAVRKGLFG